MRSLPRPVQRLAGLYVDRHSRLERLTRGDTSAWLVAIAAGIPVLAGVWVLLASGLVLSREMTWDLLFNLEGAWHIEHGHAPHRDFHDPLGPLSFALTNLGFRVTGPVPMAFIAGELIVLALLFPTAVVAAAGRLAPLPAFLVVLYVGLLILQPANVGDLLYAYSFAMSYNRWAWAALTILGLLLFVAPRGEKGRPWLDLAMAGGLVVFLFYLKITFAVVALGGMVAAIVIARHVRERWRWWSALVVLIVLIIAAPFNHPYLRDTSQFAMSGYARVDLFGHLNVFAANRAEFTLYAATIGLLAWLWQSGRSGFEAVVSAALLTGIGMFVLSQNAQQADMPVGIVITALAYNTVAALGRGPRAVRPSELTTILLIVLVWPVMSVGASAKVLAGYYRATTKLPQLLMPDTFNLRGLAVPARDADVSDALARAGYEVRSPLREPPLRDPLAQGEYVETLIEAAALLNDRPQRILILDQVNPLPFVLGYPPPRGSTLWLSPHAPERAPHEVFDDVDVVLVPKYSTYAPGTAYLLDTYGGYLAQTFPVRTQSASWTFLRRPVPSPSD